MPNAARAAPPIPMRMNALRCFESGSSASASACASAAASAASASASAALRDFARFLVHHMRTPIRGLPRARARAHHSERMPRAASPSSRDIARRRAPRA